MELLRKRCATIDAEFRDWDVLLGIGFHSSYLAIQRAKCNFLMADLLAVLRDKFMRRVVLGCVLCFFVSSLAANAENSKPVPTIAVSQIHAGMKGVAYTVFQGVKPEAMDVEVLGVLRNANGPKGDIILVRLGGAKAEYTGVVAGMSGSPVYFDGKLAGAVAFRIGEFSKEPIAGVTPISEMLEINALDRSPAEEAAARPSVNGVAGNIAGKTASPGDAPWRPGSEGSRGFANYLKPIETPLVCNGFYEDTVHRFASVR